MAIAKTLFFIFLVIFVVLLLGGLFVGRKISGGWRSEPSPPLRWS